tara:strand:+ start:47 stop:253 length:207 start_codon:yes stop_codon:yes gene_type:complete
MKPVVQIWIKEKSLDQIARGKYPSTWWRQCPAGVDIDAHGVICITVSSDWFVQMRDYENELNSKDLPF